LQLSIMAGKVWYVNGKNLSMEIVFQIHI
jgi:hypothetical protein